MKAVILAAGMGTRLRPITEKVPKCMVKVNKETIIENQINNLIDNGINDILVVGGYKYNTLKEHIERISRSISILDNEDYDKTNNMYSLYMAKEFINNEEFILLNGDVFFEKDIIKNLLINNYPDLIVCDNDNYIEESMKITVKDGKIQNISKKISPEESYGTTIDIYKFSSSSAKKLFAIIDNIINKEKNLNSWSEVAIDKLFNYVDFKPLDIDYKWVEIDNHDDLALAKDLFSK